MVINYNEISPNSAIFKEIEQLYLQFFPSDERRELSDFENIARENDHFSVLEVKIDNNSIGFLNFWHFNTFIYIEHFAVQVQNRNQGIGGRVLDEFVSKIGIPVILEAELPETPMAQRRIAFYERHGFRSWHEVEYIQPPYDATRHAMPLLLMTKGFDNAEQVQNAATTIQREVYGA